MSTTEKKKPKKGQKAAPSLKKIEIKDNGKTDDELIIWTSDTLMDLKRYVALKMDTREIDGKEYLFIESGGFNKKAPADWTSPWTVFEKK